MFLRTGERFIRWPDFILSVSTVVRCFCDEIANHILEGRTSGTFLLYFVWGQDDVAIEEIGGLIVNDVLHCLYGSCNGSVWAPEYNHLCFVFDDASVGFANAFCRLCSLNHNYWFSPFNTFYRLSALFCKLRREMPVACAKPRWRMSANVSGDRRFLETFKLSAFTALSSRCWMSRSNSS